MKADCGKAFALGMQLPRVIAPIRVDHFGDAAAQESPYSYM